MDTDQGTGEINCDDPRAYAAIFKTYDEDDPSFHVAMLSHDSHLWKEAMVKKKSGLLKQNTRGSIPRVFIPKDTHGKEKIILPGTWALKLKHLLDGSPLNYKAR